MWASEREQAQEKVVVREEEAIRESGGDGHGPLADMLHGYRLAGRIVCLSFCLPLLLARRIQVRSTF